MSQDGPGDEDDEQEEDEAAGSGGEGGVGTSGNSFRAADEGDDPLAGLTSDEDEDGADITNIILCQFDKVSRLLPHAANLSACVHLRHVSERFFGLHAAKRATCNVAAMGSLFAVSTVISRASIREVDINNANAQKT